MQILEMSIGFLSDLEKFRSLSSKEVKSPTANPLLSVTPSNTFKELPIMAQFLHGLGINAFANKNLDGEGIFVKTAKDLTAIEDKTISTLELVSLLVHDQVNHQGNDLHGN